MFLKIVLAVAMLVLVLSNEYQLEFDWKLNTVSLTVEMCIVTWNDRTLITLQENDHPNHLHHERIALNFNEGLNQINFFYIGHQGQISIDNVMITKPPKTINYIVNGDFQMSSFHGQSAATFLGRIPGWSATKIELASGIQFKGNSTQNKALLLNHQSKDISQRISFGRTNKYSFLSSISADIQKMANTIIAKNLQKFSELSSQSTSLASASFKVDPSQYASYGQGSGYLSQLALQESARSNSLQSDALQQLANLKPQQLLDLSPHLDFSTINFADQDLSIPSANNPPVSMNYHF